MFKPKNTNAILKMTTHHYTLYDEQRMLADIERIEKGEYE